VASALLPTLDECITLEPLQHQPRHCDLVKHNSSQTLLFGRTLMKKKQHVKPSLKDLGLLRVVTKFTF